MTKTNTYKTNARETHRPAPSSPSEVITMLKGMKKHEDKEHGKTLKYEAPRSINQKSIQNKKKKHRLRTVSSINYLEGGGGVKILLTVDKLHPVSRYIS